MPTPYAWFQSTRPARGATKVASARMGSVQFQSTRPARGATGVLPRERLRDRVSIHAPRTGRDTMPRIGAGRHKAVSIHAPRTGRDIPSRVGVGCFSRGFNPRAPHGARRHDGGGGYRRPGVSIHAPRTGRDKQRRLTNLPLGVSIHAPRTGRDLKFWLWLGR